MFLNQFESVKSKKKYTIICFHDKITISIYCVFVHKKKHQSDYVNIRIIIYFQQTIIKQFYVFLT